jgi:acetyl esterase/lipase
MRFNFCISFAIVCLFTTVFAEVFLNKSTIVYDKKKLLPLLVDIYTPSNVQTGASLGAIIHYHSGGLVSGGRLDVWFPQWLKGLYF